MNKLLPSLLMTILLFSCNNNKSKSGNKTKPGDNLKNHHNSLQTDIPGNLSGDYDVLKLAYDPQTKIITGYLHEDSESDSDPKFSCDFYLEGKLDGNKASINTYSPIGASSVDNNDFIKGSLEKVGDKKVSIHLKDDHGGCVMLGEGMSAEAATFFREKKKDWLSINYIVANKSFFYASNSDAAIQTSYLVKGDVIYVDQKSDDWLHCTYYSNNNHRSTGWIKARMVNVIKE